MNRPASTNPPAAADRSSEASRRSGPPPAGEIRPYEFPEVFRRRLGNGLPVRIAPKVPFPLATAMVVLKAGETASPAGKEGLASLVGDALEGGTKALPERELALAMAEIGAGFGAATGWDSATVAVSSLAEHLPRTLELAADVVRAPAFETHAFDRRKAQRLAAARQRLMDPSSLAADAHARLMYRDGDTYARPAGGTDASLERITAQDARAFAAQFHRTSAATLVIVGDVEPDEAVAHAERFFGDWTPAAAPVVAPRARPRSRERSFHVIDRPGSVQAEIRAGHPGIARAEPDHLPLRVANLVLGGAFASRLNLNLRERNGYTYGVRSSFAARKGPGPFVVSTAVETEVAGAAVGEILREVEQMAKEGPTAEEVASATGYLAGVFPLRLETTGHLASRIAEAVVHDLPADYYGRYRDRVRAVTREETAQAARARLRADELCVVAVGDAKALAPQLEALDAGPVAVHPAAGPADADLGGGDSGAAR